MIVNFHVHFCFSLLQVFQRRQDGSVDFYRDWIDYENGFGDVTSEHWLGNEKINRITAQGDYELRVDLMDFDNFTVYAKYEHFRVENASTKYKLSLGNYAAGDAGKINNYFMSERFL